EAGPGPPLALRSALVMDQDELFPVQPRMPEGFVHCSGFITPQEETHLLQAIGGLDFQHASYRQWTARRRIVSFGGSYDFMHNRLNPAEPVPEFLHGLRERVAGWAGVAAREFTQANITEYPAGTPLGWHRDVPDFEVV